MTVSRAGVRSDRSGRRASPTSGSVYGAPLEPAWAIRRPDLVALLEARHAITLVRGGSGFGKTMLVSQWANASETDGVWIDVDDDIAERSAFWMRVFAMVEDSGTLAVDARWIPSAEQVSAGGDLRRFLTRFASHLEADFTIIVDDAHRLDSPAVEDDLRAMLRITNHLRVVVATRSVSSFERRDDRAAVDIEEIEARRLLFTPRECALVIVRSVLTVDAKLAAEVHEITGGMPLATRLFAERLDGSQRLTTAREMDSVVGRVADALVAAVNAPGGSSEADFWAFLQRASLLDGVTDREAARLGEVDAEKARNWLDAARSLGFGFWDTDGDISRFHFVPITARVLEKTVSTRSDGGRSASADAAAAEVLWGRGDARAAWARAIRTEQFVLAERILRESFIAVTDDESSAFDILLAVPTAKLRRFPYLTAMLGLVHATSGKGRAVGSAYLAAAEQFARARSTEVGPDERLAMLGVRLIALRVEARWAAALSVASDVSAASERFEIDERPLSPGILVAAVLQASLTFFGAGQNDAAARLAERALTVPGLRAELVAQAHAVLSAVHASTGAMRRAQDHLSALERVRTGLGRWGWADLASALVRAEENDLPGSRAAIESIIRSAGPEIALRVVPLRAVIDAAEGKSLMSISAVSDAVPDRDRTMVPPSVRSGLGRSVVVLYLAVGALAQAKSAVRSFDKGDPSAGVSRAQIALIEDRALEAVAAASDALAATGIGPRTRAELLIARAAASLRLGGERASLHDLSEGLRVLSSNGLRSPWCFLVESDRSALAGLAERSGLLDARAMADLEAMPMLFTRLDSFVELTAREREVLTLLVSGLSVSVIAKRLVVSPNTVKKQRASIYRKLGATTREESAIAAIARGLLDS
ncbi:ATP/maltotriose-dependent transcriptional regulator MalT [Labedella gwakjiensis]|uniref:ATP/maltotriose-dependent transcriptional regulator MalT n=1 Tax=Labedella gwakjiensis TaxID=390269 RepID=A0A2P8GXC6_9MICO|nr:LuxR family transcriptional regulator [Labedella gwakjiensis]PSL38609.1 ATP/maltotriose-dependent transcriptional regulator MalT [Labedella gwakjiensis]RUQ86887.1 LuxR family transcriptional regulator [Labedella gwakjiensis]